MILADLWGICMWDSHHCIATLSFLWQSLFDWFWIYDGNNSEQSNNFPLAITLPFGTLSLREKWMCWDLSMSLVAQCQEQIKVRIQMRSMWLLNSTSGSSAFRNSAFVWLFTAYQIPSVSCLLTLTVTLAGKYHFLHFIKKETDTGNVMQQIF